VNWPGIIQQPVNAASRRIDVKTARPGVNQFSSTGVPRNPRVPQNM